MKKDIVPGAQTERRGGAGPVGGLLGGKDPTGRFVCRHAERDTYGFSFVCFNSLRHFAASSGLLVAS
jgi:hypothetical protein